MPGKKAHKPRDPGAAGTYGVSLHSGPGRKSGAQTEGQFARAPKGKRGQFGDAGDPPMLKK